MKRLLLLAATFVTLTGFVYDGGTIPSGKVDIVFNPHTPANQKIVAADWNTLAAAVYDLQGAVTFGPYFGYQQDRAYPPTPPDGGTYVFVFADDGGFGSAALRLETSDGTVHLVGSGSVTSVASGAGLTGGPITGTGTLSIPTGGVTSTMVLDGTLVAADWTGGNVSSPTFRNNTSTSPVILQGQVVNNNVAIAVKIDNTVTLTVDGGELLEVDNNAYKLFDIRNNNIDAYVPICFSDLTCQNTAASAISGLTPAAVVYANSPTTLGTDANTSGMYYDAANHRLSIGTTVPQTPFEVKISGAYAISTPTGFTDAEGNTGVGEQFGNLTITKSGSTDATFTLGASGSHFGMFWREGDHFGTGDMEARLITTPTTGWSLFGGDVSSGVLAGVGLTSPGVAPITIAPNYARAMTFFNGGNISIGSTSDQSRLLYVNGTLSINGQVDVLSHKMINLTNGASAQDAAAFGQISSALTAAGLSGLTTNAVPYASSSTAITTDSNAAGMYYDAANHRLAVGTATPQTPFEVKISGAYAISTPTGFTDAEGNTGVGEQFGNVTITKSGSTDATFTLGASGSHQGVFMQVADVLGTGDVSIRVLPTSTTGWALFRDDVTSGVSAGVALASSSSSAPVSIAPNKVRALTAFNGGNISIGSTSDQSKQLYVNGTTQLHGAATLDSTASVTGLLTAGAGVSVGGGSTLLGTFTGSVAGIGAVGFGTCTESTVTVTGVRIANKPTCNWGTDNAAALAASAVTFCYASADDTAVIRKCCIKASGTCGSDSTETWYARVTNGS